MNSSEFLKRSDDLIRKEVKTDNLEECLFPLKILAWKKLSENKLIDSRYSFNKFLKEGKTKQDFIEIIQFFIKSNSFKIFIEEDLDFIRKISDRTFIHVINLSDKVKDYPIVADLIIELCFQFTKGEYILPEELINLSLKLLENNSFKEVYNPYPGLYQLAYYISNKFNVSVYTEDPKITTIPYLINVLNNANINPVFSDPLNSPGYIEGHKLKEFDFSVSFPPLNMRGFIQQDVYGRFRISQERKGALDTAIIEHILSQTKEKACIYTSFGFLTRNFHTEKEFKKWLINEGYLEAVISLPENLLLNTAISTALLILNKNKKSSEILFINASNLYERAPKGRKNVLKDINKIVDVFKNKKELEGFSHIATIDEIKKNDFVLDPERYVVTEEKKQIEKLLKNFQLISLKEVAQVINSPLIRREEGEIEIYEVQISDIPEEGFIKNVNLKRKVNIRQDELKEASIRKYDILLTTKGKVGKAGIVIDKPEDQIWIPGQSITIIRAPNKEKAVALYMFLKSDIGKYLLNSIKVGKMMESISTKSLMKLKILKFKKQQINKLNQIFEEELKTYEEIEQRKKKIEELNKNLLNQLI